MKQIRRGVFETNSSSTHSICIVTGENEKLKYPSRLVFRCEQFGWGEDVLRSSEEKAAYLYASILSLYDRDEVKEITTDIWEMLFSVGVQCRFEKPVYWNDDDSDCVNAYVDHAGDADHFDFVEKVIHDKERLLRYLFSNKSYVMTGNDGSDRSVEICEDYPHEEYYKWN